MRGTLSLISALAILIAACGEQTADTTVAPTSTEAPTTTEFPAAVLLSYNFEPGTTSRYEVEFVQNIVMSASGDPSVMGGEEVPGTADLEVSGLTTFTQTVEAGAEPGTFDITVVGDFSDLTVTGTADGEPVDPEEIPDLAEIDPVRTTFTVDEQGNILSSTDGSVGGDPLAGDFGALGGMGTPGMEFGSLVGPSLAEREVTVGDSWSETIEEPMPFGGEGITTSVENRVTGTETVEGVEVFVIETTSTTTAIEFDLGQMMIGFFESFMPEEATDEERAELEAMMEDLRFLMTVEPSTYLTTTWFDPDAGQALRSESSGATQMTFDVNFPDEATGEMVAFAMDMTLDQQVFYRFLGIGSA